MSDTEAWTSTPARGYSWAPFSTGNTVSLRHGARSRRIYEPLAADLAAGLLDERPDLQDFPDALAAWAEAEARAELLRRWIAEQTLFDEEDKPRSGVLTWLRSFEGQAESARRTLGLDPRSSAELMKLRAEATGQVFNIEAVIARGRERRLAAEERQALIAAQDGAGESAAQPDGQQDHDTGSQAHGAVMDATGPTSDDAVGDAVMVESTGVESGPAPVDDHTSTS